MTRAVKKPTLGGAKYYRLRALFQAFDQLQDDGVIEYRSSRLGADGWTISFGPTKAWAGKFDEVVCDWFDDVEDQGAVQK